MISHLGALQSSVFDTFEHNPEISLSTSILKISDFQKNSERQRLSIFVDQTACSVHIPDDST